jgi:hypothetical protein
MIHRPLFRKSSVRSTAAAILAFLEDHTIPDRKWAEEVRLAFEECSKDTTAICYPFANGSPDTYLYRPVFMEEYSALTHPLSEGEAPSATANKIDCRLEVLISLGDKLDDRLWLVASRGLK